MPTWQGESAPPPCLPASAFSISLFALPFVRSLAAVFNCFCLLFIYCLSMSLSICIVYFRWRHKPRRSGRQFDCLSRSTLLSLSLYLLFSVSSLIIMFFACKVQCQQRRVSDKQREAETDRETGA